jgi:hypothetical protein
LAVLGFWDPIPLRLEYLSAEIELALVPLVEARSGLEFHAAMHNI